MYRSSPASPRLRHAPQLMYIFRHDVSFFSPLSFSASTPCLAAGGLRSHVSGRWRLKLDSGGPPPSTTSPPPPIPPSPVSCLSLRKLRRSLRPCEQHPGRKYKCLCRLIFPLSLFLFFYGPPMIDFIRPPPLLYPPPPPTPPSLCPHSCVRLEMPQEEEEEEERAASGLH